MTAVQLCGLGGRTHSRSDVFDDQNPRCEAFSSPVMRLMTRVNTEWLEAWRAAGRYLSLTAFQSTPCMLRS